MTVGECEIVGAGVMVGAAVTVGETVGYAVGCVVRKRKLKTK
jgi:hypothetical protein